DPPPLCTITSAAGTYAAQLCTQTLDAIRWRRVGREQHLDRSGIASCTRTQRLHELNHAAGVPACSSHDLHAHAISFPLVVTAELHHVAARENLGAGLRRARATGVPEDGAEQAEQAVRNDTLRYLIRRVALRDVRDLVSKNAREL